MTERRKLCNSLLSSAFLLLWALLFSGEGFAANISPEIQIESRIILTQGKPLVGKVKLAVQLGNFDSNPVQIYYQKNFDNYEVLASANGKIVLKCDLTQNDYNENTRLDYDQLIAQFPLSARIIITNSGQDSVFPASKLNATPFALRAAQADTVASVSANSIQGVIPFANLPASTVGAGSIVNAQLADNSVDGNNIKTGAISGLKIDSGTFGTGLSRSPTTGQVSVDSASVASKTYADGKVINDNNSANWNSTSASPSQASVKSVVDNLNSSISTVTTNTLPKAGGIMSGDIAMGNHKISNLANPTADSDAANKVYVDSTVTASQTNVTTALTTASNAQTAAANAQTAATAAQIAAAAAQTTANNAVSLDANQTITGNKNFSGTVTVGSSSGPIKASSGVLAAGAINLASSSEATGLLPAANGGTGVNLSAATGIINSCLQSRRSC